jgi:leader peptidase (prepilin peptidase)/N-methyltransferase
MMDGLYEALILFFFLGLSVGSFLNVCIYRLPRGESIVRPSSQCTACGTRIKPYDLVPLLSYLILGGKCRHCGEKISLRYPAVELLTGLCFLVVYFKFGLTALLVKYAVFAAILIAVTFIDMEHYIIPDQLVIAGLAAGILSIPLAGDVKLLSSLYGILSTTGFLLLVYFLSPLIFKQEGMGGGDIKFSVMMGLFMGWPLSFLAVFIACCLAGLGGMLLIAGSWKRKRDIIPFGPFLAAGSFISFMWGQDLINWYITHFLLAR